MGGCVAQFALGADAGGPMHDERRADAAFVNPRLVPAKGRITGTGKPRPEAQIAFGTAGRYGWIMPVVANHHLGAGTIVGGKENDGVGVCVHRLELRDDAPDLLIHAVHHGGVKRHFGCLKAVLFIG